VHVLRGQMTGSEFQAYCEMTAEGGGWTLVLNQGPSFDPQTTGLADALCFGASCTSLAYSEVLLEEDVMLDMSELVITEDDYDARVIVIGVQPGTRARTLRTLFNEGPYFVEAEDNSNVTVRVSGNRSCQDALARDMSALVCATCEPDTPCDARVLVFGDVDSSCEQTLGVPFAIGGAESHTVPWTNCSGWPQLPNSDLNYYPDFVRIWVR
jgi:hypothetical protein